VLAPDRHATVHEALGTTTGPRRRQEFYLLSRGRLIPECGARYHGVSRKERGTATTAVRDRARRPTPAAAASGCTRTRPTSLVWSEVTALLSQPERLLALADEYLGIRETEVEVERDHIEAIDTKLATLREARAQRVAQALKAGVGGVGAKAAVAELEPGERPAPHRARLEEWRDHNQAEKERIRRLQGLAAYA
jgi:hypothetical protein